MSSYAHACRKLAGHDEYEISWSVDYKYVGSRLRYPRIIRRVTDRAGALRFCKRWGLAPIGLTVARKRQTNTGEPGSLPEYFPEQ